MTREEREKAEAIKEQGEATNMLMLVAGAIGLYAGSLYVQGGYDAENSLMRLVGVAAALFGVVLLVTYRYSYSALGASIVLIVAGYYVASAPLVGGTRTVRTSAASVSAEESPTPAPTRRIRKFEDYGDWSGFDLNRYCYDLAKRTGRTWSTTNPPCTQEEAQQEAASDPTRYQDKPR